MGPEATTALMTAIAIRPLAAGHPAHYAALATSLALLVGLMALGAWALRLGFVADLLYHRKVDFFGRADLRRKARAQHGHYSD